MQNNHFNVKTSTPAISKWLEEFWLSRDMRLLANALRTLPVWVKTLLFAFFMFPAAVLWYINMILASSASQAHIWTKLIESMSGSAQYQNITSAFANYMLAGTAIVRPTVMMLYILVPLGMIGMVFAILLVIRNAGTKLSS